MLPNYNTPAFDWCLAGTAGAGIALASTGIALWEQSDYLVNMVPHPPKPFSGTSIFGLSLFIAFCTFAVMSTYMFVSTVLHKVIAGSKATGNRRDSSNTLLSANRSVGGGAGGGLADEEVVSLGATDSATSMLSMFALRTQLRVAVGMYAGCALVFFILGMIAVTTWGRDPLLTCGVIFCVGDPSRFPQSRTQPSNGLSFNATVGMMTFFSLVPLAVLMTVRLVTLRGDTCAAMSTADTLTLVPATPTLSAPNVKPKHHRGAPNPKKPVHLLLVGIVPMAVFVFCFAILTFYLPNDTRRFTASKIANLAALRATYGTISGNLTAPELPSAWFRTRNVVLSDYLVLNLFPGNIFFYVYVLLMMFAMWGLRLSVLGRTWMRAPVRWLPRRGWNYSDLLMSCITILFSCFFFWYWVHDHNYKKTWTLAKHGDSAAGLFQESERWGRATGQFATFFLSLLMFPASRSASLPLFRAMGLSWESFIWGHRMLGYAMLLATLAHVVLFLVNFHVNGVLKSNLTSLPTQVGRKKVKNDFSVIPVTWATLVVFVSMGVFACHPLRRRFFELFYYSHLVGSCVLFPTVLWHASAGWEYLMPGLSLWFLDRFVRMHRSGAPVQLLKCAVVDHHTIRIDFQCTGGGRTVRAGQFVFLNVPEVSLLQWHPFTTLATSAVEGAAARSSGDDKRLTVFIKTVGSEASWTSTLYRRVVAATVAAEGDHPAALPSPKLTLRVDGPCGCPLDGTDLSDFSSVYFVAGGVGVVPCAALYQQLRDQALFLAHYAQDVGGADGSGEPAASSPPRLPAKVKVIWVCRSEHFVNAFAPTLLGDADETDGVGGDGGGHPRTRFDCTIFLTSGASARETSLTTMSPTASSATECDDAGGVAGGTLDDHAEPARAHGPDATAGREGPAATSSSGGSSSSSPSSPPLRAAAEPGAAAARSAPLPDGPPHAAGTATRRVTFSHGRPNWLAEFASTVRAELPPEDAAREAAGADAPRPQKERVLVFACGPSMMTRELRVVAESLGATFHREEFNL